MFAKSASAKFAICIYDVLTGKQAMIENTPFKVGSAVWCDWQIRDESLPEEWFEIQRKGASYFVVAGRSTEQIAYDGDLDCTQAEIEEKADHTLHHGGQFLVLRKTRRAADWLAKMNYRKWYLVDEAGGELLGPYAPGSLAEELSRHGGEVVLCEGMSTRGFYASVLLPALEPGGRQNGHTPTLAAGGKPPPLPPVSGQHASWRKGLGFADPPSLPTEGGPWSSPPQSLMPAIPSLPPPDTDHGEFTCPVCWLKFDRGDVMNIAAHATLRGDPLLGEFEMQRFHATRFNDRGLALDPMNIPAPDQACPHCRRKLPPGFLDQPHHIFSIVGAPSSGKSYYLSVLVRILHDALFRSFGVAFRDADPSGNQILNQMVSRLFGQYTPEDAFLAKTDLEGELYETMPRYGQKVKLPRPFIFNLSSRRDPAEDFSVVFYDNAGEHFQPGRNSTDSPGAQHIAVASGIFFLFDPLHSPDFLRRMGTVSDPQAADHRDEQQDVLLAETEARIKSLLGLATRSKISTPLAVMLGKCDTWLHLLGEAPLEPAVRDGRLDQPALRRNSARLRELLCAVSPSLVGNAEAISSEVMYFAISPLGSSPVVFTDAAGIRKVGPDPALIAPIDVEVPTLWVLAQIAPSMFPSHN